MATTQRAGRFLTRLATTYAEIVGDAAERWSSSLSHIREDEDYGIDVAVRDAAGVFVFADDTLDRLWNMYAGESTLQEAGTPDVVFFVEKDGGLTPSANEVDEATIVREVPVQLRPSDLPPIPTALHSVGGGTIDASKVYVEVTPNRDAVQISLGSLGGQTFAEGEEYSGWVLLRRPNDTTAIARVHVVVV